MNKPVFKTPIFNMRRSVRLDKPPGDHEFQDRLLGRIDMGFGFKRCEHAGCDKTDSGFVAVQFGLFDNCPDLGDFFLTQNQLGPIGHPQQFIEFGSFCWAVFAKCMHINHRGYVLRWV